MALNKFIAAALCAVLATSGVVAAEHPYKVTPELDKAIQTGLHELYNFNFDESLRIFATVKDQEAEHPMVAFGVASVHWWRISALVLETDADESKPFLAAVENCIKVSTEKIKKGDETGEAHLALGGALGLYGRWQATNREWSGAYFKGKKAYKYLVQALKINPNLIDANMGKGIFDYFVATLPSVVRMLAFIGMGGNPSVGLEELKLAAEKGIYARTPSTLFLAGIYANEENKPEESLKVLQTLLPEFPKSSFIHMLEIIALYNSNKVNELKVKADAYEKNIQTGVYLPGAEVSGHFAKGLSYFKAKEWTMAESHFSQGAAVENVKDPWCTWSRLYLGYVKDAQGNRESAVELYNKVLKELRRWGSHDSAKERLKKPFTGSDEDLKKLVL